MARGKFRFKSKELRKLFTEMVAFSFIEKMIPEIENNTGVKWNFENHFENRLQDAVFHSYAVGSLEWISSKQVNELIEESKQSAHYQYTIRQGR